MGAGAVLSISDPRSAIPKGSGTNGTYVLFETYNGGIWTGPDDWTSAFQIAWDANNLYIGIVVTDDSTIRRLNRFYRGIAKTTDVLSFALTEDVADFITPHDGVSRLGEVIISYPRAVAQAEERSHSVEREIAWLLVHGILHLLGYDHQDDATEARMRQREEALLKEIDV